ncbi:MULTISPECIES: histidine phosphatase family protein [unclassified Paenibacillus]|uniref:histidine phosphatase family protein n=1 Tax=unclassified Paenibacillus TaxID=185978 RepID=UPI0009710594|nr:MULTISPECIES: histidine phosphatase family protein [unclassified Paenibacillus]ASS65092.1 histidine phosphatase family protein [Paenibacillus sp. RUD330]
MKTVYLIRHAHSVYTPDERGRPLSDAGKMDAGRVADLLEHEEIAEIWSSPYRRSVQTVEKLASRLAQPIRLQEGFKERLLSEAPVRDFEASVKRLWEEPEHALPGGESNRMATLRGMEALRGVLESSRSSRIAVGTHGNIMAMMMNALDGSFGYEFWRGLEMPDIYKLSFGTEGRYKGAERIWSR